MTNEETLSEAALQRLLSATDEGGAEACHLEVASSASLFILSRRALSPAVRAAAEKILAARLHEGDAPATPPANAANDGELPPEYATHRHFYKFCEADRWILTTRSGLRIAAFDSEAALDHWWQGLKKQRGRILTRVRRGPVSS